MGIKEGENRMNEVTCERPLVALRGLVVMPDVSVNFDISRKISVSAIEEAMRHDQTLFLAAQKDAEIEDPGPEDVYTIGTMVRIRQILKLPQKNQIRVTVEGRARVRILDIYQTSPHLKAEGMILPAAVPAFSAAEAEAMQRTLASIVEDFEKIGTKFNPELHKILELPSVNVVNLTNQLCANLPVKWQDRQRLLEAVEFRDRYICLCRIMRRELEVLKINQEIQQKVRVRLDKNQREYILREQMKEIREELGDDVQTEAEEYLEKLQDFKASDEVKEKLEKEIRRFQTMAGNTSESSVYRNYIETILEMPWEVMGEDNQDLNEAERILREDHYGLEKVKERILDYLAVRLMNASGKGPILCLVGPPGTGKTSIGRSIARALNKKYVRISLGGLHDEAEIRGHRKTYIGAMPGRIAASILQAGVRNPVILLDEIDKIGSDYRGDAAFSAMLEVLDGEQNSHFRDNYLEVPLDLSEVLFVCTANSLHTIPRPLLDRMEVIEINTYTQNEKLHIAREYLVDKQMQEAGLKKRQLQISDEALMEIIMSYTREAGVRSLERRIGEICRKTARLILEGERKSVRVSPKMLPKFLGPKKFDYNKINERNEIGVVRGLAWTSVGGDTLSVEVNTMPGKGKFELTGQMGNVMKESAMAGISYLRSVSDQFGIEEGYFESHDIHIHIPEGAVPKDGPSAGVTMTTAMLSAVTNIPVRADVAMTGEITLRGRVLPIGGLREKTIAARIAGIDTVIVPEKNKSDIEELSEEITGGMHFIYASTMQDILPVALEHMPSAAR